MFNASTVFSDFVTGVNNVISGLAAHKAETAEKHMHSSGSGEDGSWIRFDDGTQICWHNISSGVGSTLSDALFISPIAEWNYPASFVSTPVLMVSVARLINSGANPISASRPSSADIGLSSVNNIRVWYTKASETVESSVHCIAIGRWK